MKKTVTVILLTVLLLAGCGRRAPQYKNAASHLGDPRVVQIIPPGQAPAAVSVREEVMVIMNVLNEVEVRKLSVEEELELVIARGATLDATELRFKDNSDTVYKALLLTDGSLLVVEGAIGESDGRREIYLSAPEQTALQSQLQKHLGSE